MKWCLVAAGVKDLTRPADKLSVSQNVGPSLSILSFDAYGADSALVSLGCYRVHLGPLLPGYHPYKLQFGCCSYPLLAPFCRSVLTSLVQVNFFVGLSGLTQLGRIAKYAYILSIDRSRY